MLPEVHKLRLATTLEHLAICYQHNYGFAAKAEHIASLFW